MPFISQPMTDHAEKEPVPGGKYLLRIKNYKVLEDDSGNPTSILIFHEVDGEPDAADVVHFFGLVRPDDDDNKKYWKLAFQKGYLKMFGLEWTDSGYDPESWLGAESEVELEQEFDERRQKTVNRFAEGTPPPLT